jgi:hypothetical protein
MSTIININISISKESSVHRRIATAMEYNAIVSFPETHDFLKALWARDYSLCLIGIPALHSAPIDCRGYVIVGLPA